MAFGGIVGKSTTTYTDEEIQQLVATRAEVIIGTYVGNGQSFRTINLGVTPKAVLVICAQVTSGANWNNGSISLSTSEQNMQNQTLNLVNIIENGFRVAYNASNQQTNINNIPYNYIAFV